jgi:hypothetical protein
VDPYAAQLLAGLRQSGFREIAGSRLSATLPISRALLNRLVEDALTRTKAPVSRVDVRPHDGDRFDAVITLTWRFAPPLTVAFSVLRQPQFPDSPELVLRWSFLGGLGLIASRFVGALGRLPPGVRVEEDRVILDIRILAAGGPASELLPFITRLELHTAAGRAILDVELHVHD